MFPLRKSMRGGESGDCTVGGVRCGTDYVQPKIPENLLFTKPDQRENHMYEVTDSEIHRGSLTAESEGLVTRGKVGCTLDVWMRRVIPKYKDNLDVKRKRGQRSGRWRPTSWSCSGRCRARSASARRTMARTDSMTVQNMERMSVEWGNAMRDYFKDMYRRIRGGDRLLPGGGHLKGPGECRLGNCHVGLF